MLAFRHHPAIAEALELDEALAHRHRSEAARRSPPAAAASGLRGGFGRLGVGGRRSCGEPALYLNFPLALAANASTVERIVRAKVSST